MFVKIIFLVCVLGLQRRVLKVWLQVQRRHCSADIDATEARLQELYEADGLGPEDSEDEEEEEQLPDSEPLDSDIQLSDSGKQTVKCMSWSLG